VWRRPGWCHVGERAKNKVYAFATALNIVFWLLLQAPTLPLVSAEAAHGELCVISYDTLQQLLISEDPVLCFFFSLLVF
jgi:hypothetical protein